MKNFDNLKLASSLREISSALDIISGIVRIFAVGLMVLQAVLLVKNTKKNIT
jgi:hypothetical protein